jgi:hypothetical protein
MTSLPQHLLSLETSLVTQPTRSSREHLEALLAPDFFEFTTSGRRLSRAEIIEALITQPPSTWRIEDFDLHQLSPTHALVTFRTARHDPATSRTTHALRSSLWGNDGNAWRLVFHQGTLLPG